VGGVDTQVVGQRPGRGPGRRALSRGADPPVAERLRHAPAAAPTRGPPSSPSTSSSPPPSSCCAGSSNALASATAGPPAPPRAASRSPYCRSLV